MYKNLILALLLSGEVMAAGQSYLPEGVTARQGLIAGLGRDRVSIAAIGDLEQYIEKLHLEFYRMTDVLDLAASIILKVPDYFDVTQRKYLIEALYNIKSVEGRQKMAGLLHKVIKEGQVKNNPWWLIEIARYIKPFLSDDQERMVNIFLIFVPVPTLREDPYKEDNKSQKEFKNFLQSLSDPLKEHGIRQAIAQIRPLFQPTDSLLDRRTALETFRRLGEEDGAFKLSIILENRERLPAQIKKTWLLTALDEASRYVNRERIREILPRAITRYQEFQADRRVARGREQESFERALSEAAQFFRDQERMAAYGFEGGPDPDPRPRPRLPVRGGGAFEVHDYADTLVQGAAGAACASPQEKKLNDAVLEAVQQRLAQKKIKPVSYKNAMEHIRNILKTQYQGKELTSAEKAIIDGLEGDRNAKYRQELQDVYNFMWLFHKNKMELWMSQFIGESIKAYEGRTNPTSCLKGIQERIVLGLRGIDDELDQMFAQPEGANLLQRSLDRLNIIAGNPQERERNAKFVAERLVEEGYTLETTPKEAGKMIMRFVHKQLKESKLSRTQKTIFLQMNPVYGETVEEDLKEEEGSVLKPHLKTKLKGKGKAKDQ